jgi:hypothetical protein
MKLHSRASGKPARSRRPESSKSYAAENPGPVNRGSVTGRVMLEGKAIHIPDAALSGGNLGGNSAHPQTHQRPSQARRGASYGGVPWHRAGLGRQARG